jgi:adenylate kinase family enzyme
VELDALIHGPNWVDAPPAVFRARTAEATAGDGWVVDGNYSVVRDLVWPRAETVIWLDYPMHVPLRRVTWRTLRRVVLRETIFNGNRETFRNAIFNREGLILWVLKTHRSRRREFIALFQQPENAHLTVHRFRSPRETEAWLTRVTGGTGRIRSRRL